MSRSYTSSPQCASMACSETALPFLPFTVLFWAVLVARYLRAPLTVTNTQVGCQPAEVQGGRGSVVHKASFSPLALSILM
jgi:hypothetical protein